MTIYSDTKRLLPRLEGIIERERDCCIAREEAAGFLSDRVALLPDELALAVAFDKAKQVWTAVTSCRIMWGHAGSINALAWDEILIIEHEKYERHFGEHSSVFTAIPILTTAKVSIKVEVPPDAFVLFRKLIWQISRRTQFQLGRELT